MLTNLLRKLMFLNKRIKNGKEEKEMIVDYLRGK